MENSMMIVLTRKVANIVSTKSINVAHRNKIFNVRVFCDTLYSV